MKKQLSFSRKERIASKVQILVGEILRDNYTNLNITLTGAESAGGLNFVRLFYTAPVGADVQKRLDEINKTIRYELAARLNQKFVPEIKFTYDDTLERARRIDELLEKIDK